MQPSVGDRQRHLNAPLLPFVVQNEEHEDNNQHYDSQQHTHNQHPVRLVEQIALGLHSYAQQVLRRDWHKVDISTRTRVRVCFDSHHHLLGIVK